MGLGLGVICGLAAALSLLAFTPRFDLFGNWDGSNIETSRVPGLLEQLADPFGWDHFRALPNAMRWRVLFPVVGNFFHLTPALYLTLPAVGMIILLGVSVTRVYRATRHPGWAAVTAVLVATSSAFFVTTGWLGQFDSYYLIALVLVVFSPNPVTVWAACALGPWVDERFLLMLPACVALQWIPADPARGGVRRGARGLGPILAGVGPYVCLRLWAAGVGETSVPIQLAIQAQQYQAYLSHLPEGWWMGFRLGWLPIGLVWMARERGGWQWAATAGLLVGGLATISLLAWDSSRSIAVLLPFLLEGLIAMHQRWPKWGLRLMVGAACLNLLLPASHVVKATNIPLRSGLFHPATPKGK